VPTVTDVLVVTCRVPVGELDELELTPVDHTLSIVGPAGYTHELELPEEADMERLEVELYKHFLEVRAPLRLS
jgi:hypothetical protein